MLNWISLNGNVAGGQHLKLASRLSPQRLAKTQPVVKIKRPEWLSEQA